MESLNLLFSGDFSPCRRYEDLVLKRRGSVFGDLVCDIRASDVSFLNLELPLCGELNGIEKSGPNLRANPQCIEAAQKAGFNIVGLANNHIMDYGEAGLKETIKSCDVIKLPFCGAGLNLEEAQEPYITNVRGLKVAIIAVAENEFSIASNGKAGAAPLCPIENTVQVEQARINADIVVVTIHGGNELFSFPRPGLRKICKFLLDRGADAIICHHSHVAGPIEFYNGKPIVYSLGNLIFDHVNPPRGWNNSYAISLKYDVDNKSLISHEVIPFTQNVEQGGVIKMKGEDKKKFLIELERLNNTLINEDRYFAVWEDFCRDNSDSALIQMFFPLTFPGVRRISRFFSLDKILLPKKSIAKKVNMIRCESHRELLIRIMEEKC